MYHANLPPKVRAAPEGPPDILDNSSLNLNLQVLILSILI